MVCIAHSLISKPPGQHLTALFLPYPLDYWIWFQFRFLTLFPCCCHLVCSWQTFSSLEWTMLWRNSQKCAEREVPEAASGTLLWLLTCLKGDLLPAMRSDSLPWETDTENRASIGFCHADSCWQCLVSSVLGSLWQSQNQGEEWQIWECCLRSVPGDKETGISSLTVKSFDGNLSYWMGNAKESSDLSHAHF